MLRGLGRGWGRGRDESGGEERGGGRGEERTLFGPEASHPAPSIASVDLVKAVNMEAMPWCDVTLEREQVLQVL